MSTFSKGDTFKHGSWSLGHARKVFREIRHKYPAGGVVSNVAAWISANKAVIPAGTPVQYNHSTKEITALLTVSAASGSDPATAVDGLLQEDIYLEVFMEDMKYSDTPISASVSENLADLYQEFFNLIHSIQDALTETQHEMLCQCKINFVNYWGQTLCNVLRALNAIYYGI